MPSHFSPNGLLWRQVTSSMVVCYGKVTSSMVVFTSQKKRHYCVCELRYSTQCSSGSAKADSTDAAPVAHAKFEGVGDGGWGRKRWVNSSSAGSIFCTIASRRHFVMFASCTMHIAHAIKLRLPSWFINQPDSSGPEGPPWLPHLEGATGRDWTHVTPDKGYRSAN